VMPHNGELKPVADRPRQGNSITQAAQEDRKRSKEQKDRSQNQIEYSVNRLAEIMHG
jgi:hypothetical protein